MIQRLIRQFASGGGTATRGGRRPARGRGGRRGAAPGGTGARLGSAVERIIRSRR